MDETYQTRCVVRTYPRLVGNLMAVDWSKKKLAYDHLRDLPIEPIEPGKPVTLLIGTRNPQLFEILDVRRGKANEPWAFLSPLGWVVVGPCIEESATTMMINVGHSFTHENEEPEPGNGSVQGIKDDLLLLKGEYLSLQRQVERLWNHEREMEVARLRNMSLLAPRTKAQLQAEQVFKNTEDGSGRI